MWIFIYLYIVGNYTKFVYGNKTYSTHMTNIFWIITKKLLKFDAILI